jgi:hypothetical protein
MDKTSVQVSYYDNKEQVIKRTYHSYYDNRDYVTIGDLRKRAPKGWKSYEYATSKGFNSKGYRYKREQT